MDAHKAQHIKDRAQWLAYYARDLARTIGASDPNECDGLQDALDRAQADIDAIQERAARHATPHLEGSGMSENLKIWDSLKKTDPKHTKPFKRAGGFSGTAVAPIYMTQAHDGDVRPRWQRLGHGRAAL